MQLSMGHHLKGRISDVRAGVEGELAKAGQQGEPEVHVLILVAELQALALGAILQYGSSLSRLLTLHLLPLCRTTCIPQ